MADKHDGTQNGKEQPLLPTAEEAPPHAAPKWPRFSPAAAIAVAWFQCLAILALRLSLPDLASDGDLVKTLSKNPYTACTSCARPIAHARPHSLHPSLSCEFLVLAIFALAAAYWIRAITLFVNSFRHPTPPPHQKLVAGVQTTATIALVGGIFLGKHTLQADNITLLVVVLPLVLNVYVTAALGAEGLLYWVKIREEEQC